jgi:hypothetical protein
VVGGEYFAVVAGMGGGADISALANAARLIFYQTEKVAQGNDFTFNNETYYHPCRR